MKKQAYNPYLPGWEYIPDAEPHIFDGRVYIYGSHDKFNGISFCLNDYVSWSAPVDDLSDWRYEGVIFRRRQDPDGKGGFGMRCTRPMSAAARTGGIICTILSVIEG